MLPILVRVFPSLPKAQNLWLPFPLLKKKKKRLTALTEVLKTRTKMKTFSLMQPKSKGSRKGNHFLISDSILFKAASTRLLRCSLTPTVLPGPRSGKTALCHSENLAFRPSQKQLKLEHERDCVWIEENDLRVFCKHVSPHEI